MPEQRGFGLVLTRKVGESIVISNNIVVTVVSIENNKIRLGFTAPREITIYRVETNRGRYQWTAKPLR